MKRFSFITKQKVTLFPEGLIGYFLGPTLAMLTGSVFANYLNSYFSNVLNLNRWAPTFFTMLPLVSAGFVILGNIVVGQLMDRLSFASGKARPLILFSIPLSVLAMMILFVLSPFANETAPQRQSTLLVCIGIGYVMWNAVAYPFYSIPHAALVNLSTRNSESRSLLATISNATGLAAMGLVSMVLPFFLRFLFVYRMTDLPAGAVAVAGADGLPSYYTDASGAALYDSELSFLRWKWFAVILLAIAVIGMLIEFSFTRERVTEELRSIPQEKRKKTLRAGEQAKICFADRFWILIIAFFILFQLGGMLKNTSQLYFCQAMFPDAAGNYTVANGGALQGMLAILGAIPTGLGMFLVVPLAKRFGKGRAILAGSVLAVLGGIPGLIFPDRFVVVAVSFVLKALGSTPAMYLSLALLADVLEHQEAVSGSRTDGFTMSFYGAILAGMSGIATGVLNRILAELGYSSANLSSPAIRMIMPWLFIGGETICYAAIFVIMMFMKVERFTAVDQLALRVDRGEELKIGETLAVDQELLCEMNRRRAACGREEIR